MLMVAAEQDRDKIASSLIDMKASVNFTAEVMCMAVVD